MKTSEWITHPYVSTATPIIIGGCGRSGTTLLRVILDSHPNLCCGPESYLFVTSENNLVPAAEIAFRFDLPVERLRDQIKASSSLAEFIDDFFSDYAVACGKPRWAEKTPRNVTVLDYIFAHFPQAKFLHMIRDGRDTACSLRTHPRHQFIKGEIVKLNKINPWNLCVQRWLDEVPKGLAYRADPRYREVRYEDLVTQPEPTLRALFEFLGEPWDDRVLKFHTERGSSRDVRKFPNNAEATRPLYEDALGKWRTEMTHAEADYFKQHAGPLLRELGYAKDDSWQPNKD